LPQFETQIFPCRSEMVPCGQLTPPLVKPPDECAVALGDIGFPPDVNSETLS
jgi:hypothetical protein